MIIVRALVAGDIVIVVARPVKIDAVKIMPVPSLHPAARRCCLTVSYVPILVPPSTAARAIVVSIPRYSASTPPSAMIAPVEQEGRNRRREVLGCRVEKLPTVRDGGSSPGSIRVVATIPSGSPVVGFIIRIVIRSVGLATAAAKVPASSPAVTFFHAAPSLPPPPSAFLSGSYRPKRSVE
eukprot:7193060-Prymnesium_polylepis.1